MLTETFARPMAWEGHGKGDARRADRGRTRYSLEEKPSRPMSRPCPTLSTLLAASLLLLLPLPPARAGSVTADSILDQEGARQAAMEQVPRGATVTGTRCQEIGVGGMDNPRYRCTVEYGPAGATPPAARP
jgi:hypothetical protein